MYIIVFFIMLTIIILLSFYIILEKTYNKNIKEKKHKSEGSETHKSQAKIRKIFGVKSIKNNLITTDDGYLTCIVDVSTPEFDLMTDDDQKNYENKLIELIFKLNFCIKIFTVIVNKDLKSIVDNLELNRTMINNKELNEYSINFQNELEKEQEQKTIKKYYSIFTDCQGSYEEKLKDLKKKVSFFMNDMENAGCITRILKTNEIIELLNTAINKYDNIDIQYLEENGAFEIKD